MEAPQEPLKRGRGRPRKDQKTIKAVFSENDSDSDSDSESACRNSDEDFVLQNADTRHNDGREKSYTPRHQIKIISYHNHFILIDDSDDATSKTKPQRGRPRKRQKLMDSSEDSDSTSDDDFLIKPKQMKTGKRGRGRPKIIRTPSEEALFKSRRIGQFKCPHCVKFFTRSSRIAAHIRTRHGFKCNMCKER